MKKFMAMTMAMVMAAMALTGCGSSNAADDKASGDIPVIGINQYGQHASLDNCREGFLQGLEEAGLKEGVDYKIEYQNAGFDDNAATQIAQNFSAKNVALMCAIATPSATACYAAAEDKDIPVIFTAITDPEEAKLTGGNITGTSDKLPIEGQLELIRKVQPDAKTIGILYTTSEPNSVSAVKEYQEKAGEYGFKIEALGVMTQAEVNQATDTLISKGVDCFTNLTDNNVVGVLPSILEKTNEAGIPVYGSEIEQVKLGCVAAEGLDYLALGRQTGLMAAKVLVIDGQGGGLGKQLVAALSARCPQAQLTAVGTNSLAASAMRKAGAVRTATGENAVVVNCRHADIIVGPIGIVIADALLGEITPAMAAAVCQSGAKRVLIPVNHCDNYIVGVPEQPIGDLVAAAVQKVTDLCGGSSC